MFNARWWASGSRDKTTSPQASLGDLTKAEKIISAYRGSPTEKEDVATSDGKFSAEKLRSLYAQVTNETAITDANSGEIVAALRSISEILIWGDKNDPSVFEVFLEKHMLAYFVSILRQCDAVFAKPATHFQEEPERTNSPVVGSATKVRGILAARSSTATDPTATSAAFLSLKSAHHVCTQVLQLLHILFENIREDTSLYFLLSNNFINQIIGCVYDFTDDEDFNNLFEQFKRFHKKKQLEKVVLERERSQPTSPRTGEILAHYVSLMKILSSKLNPHTIHFFYTEDAAKSGPSDGVINFPLFNKALELFRHPETMVRIASRTVMLNIFNVRSTDGANRSFVRSCDLPERLISMLCSIMTTQVERLRFHLDGLVDGFPEFMVWNLTMDSSDDVTLLKQKILVSWTDRQKKGERLKDEIVEHVSFLQYVNDLVELNVEPLKQCLRDQFVKDFVLPAVIHPICHNVPLLGQPENVSDRRSLCVGLICALLLLNLAALNITEFLLFLPEIQMRELFKTLSTLLAVCRNGEVLPKDDRLLMLVLMFLTTVHEQSWTEKSLMPDFVREFTRNCVIPATVRFIHDVPQAGFLICRPIVLRLACNLIETVIKRDNICHLEDQDVAILLDAKEQSCLVLRRFFKNDNTFVNLVELEVFVQKQQKPPQIERLLERELIPLVTFCPRPLTLTDDLTVPVSASSSASYSGTFSSSATVDERGFPDLCKRWPLTVNEECRYHLKLFFMLRRLSLKVQRSLTPPGGSLNNLPAEGIERSSSTISMPGPEEMPAPFQSLQVGDVVDISSCDTIISCQMIPFHTHLATKTPARSPTTAAPIVRPSQLLLCPSDEEKWVKRFLIIHQWQMLFVEPDNRKVGFAVVRETFVLPSVLMLTEKEQRERIICCCSLATNVNHRNHDVNVLVGTDTKTILKSVFLQVQQQLSLRLKISPNDAPWNMDARYESCVRVMFDDSIRAMAASTRIRKNQERIRELKLKAINALLDLPVGVGHSGTVDNESKEGNDRTTGHDSLPSENSTPAMPFIQSRRAPIVIHGSAIGSTRSQSQDVHSHPKPVSRSRDKPAQRLSRDIRSTPGTTIPMTRLDTVGRSGFIERVEPE